MVNLEDAFDTIVPFSGYFNRGKYKVACPGHESNQAAVRSTCRELQMLAGYRFQAAKALRPLTRAITSRPSNFYTDPSKNHEPGVSTSPDISPQQREILDNALRVDQAGEIAANWIYRGQLAVLGHDPRVGPLIQEMWDQEKLHLKVMDKLQLQHQVRPTLLSDVAKAAGFALGAVTALMGKEAAMACTEAVETVIGEHYDDQLKDFESLPSSHPSIPLLRDVIKEFRDDELGHLDTAVEHHSQRAPAHALLSAVVGGGCKVAIELCKRF